MEKEFDLISYEIKSEIESTYRKCKDNKRFKHECQARRNWYYQHLRDRIVYKVYEKRRTSIFEMFTQYINSVAPSVIDKTINQFVDIGNVGVGDRI